MNEEELARVLRRDPSINIRRPLYQRPALTQPLKWGPSTPHTTKQGRTPLFKKLRTTEPLQWIPQEHIKSAWALLPQRPPVFPELPPEKHPIEEFEVVEERTRQRTERRRALREAKLAKTGPPPAPRPEILPLSPQAPRAPRPKDPKTEESRKIWPGPGDWEFKWKHNPHKDANMAVRDSIPDDMLEPPYVRTMPGRLPINRNSRIEIPIMGDVNFFPSKIPASGDCFFGSVSMALYGSTLYWHYTKYCHLWFFRYVLTHPAHPRHDYYWHLNSFDDGGGANMWKKLNTPHAWQSSDLFNVTADIYNLFVVLYEAPTIGLYGQYNATHVFFHLINRNHYESLIPEDNEVQFPFPDGVKIKPEPGRARQRPAGGKGKPFIPPPIALPVIPRPTVIDLTRVLGINTVEGALDIELVKSGIRSERRMAKKRNDPTEIRWWVDAEAREKEEEKKAEEERIAEAGNAKPPPKKVTMPTNAELAANLAKTLGQPKKPEHGKPAPADPTNPNAKKIPKRIVHDLDEDGNVVPKDQYTPGGTRKKRKFTGYGLDYGTDDTDTDLDESAAQ
ncbi:hypothetical protein EAE96_002449 [Botrytis aclada]|nr:hypothetical protein EAE96_002449 [Botrytis aclada]